MGLKKKKKGSSQDTKGTTGGSGVWSLPLLPGVLWKQSCTENGSPNCPGPRQMQHYYHFSVV